MCFEWSGLVLINCTLENYCGLHSDFHCVALGYLGVGCIKAGMCMTYDELDVNILQAGFCPYSPLNVAFCRPFLLDYYESI